MSEYLFPVRLGRRDFLRSLSVAGAATVWASQSPLHADDKPADKAPAAAKAEPVKIGTGKYCYTLDESWGKLPAGMKYGFGCAIVADAKDRIFVTSRSANPCVAIFDKNGKLEATWSKEFASGIGFEKPEQVSATAHGLYLSKEGSDEFLYWTENVAGGIGARVYKTDMNGKVLYTLGKNVKDGSDSQKLNLTNPTDVAVAPNGDIYIVDGYGSFQLHRFDKSFKLIKTIGGAGTEHGKFKTNHGVWVSQLRDEPELFIADRANNRIEIFSLNLDYKRTIGGLRNPCCFYEQKGLMYVPELGARVSIIDAKDTIVAQLGDGEKVKNGKSGNVPECFATPHALTLDSAGNLYVIEWLAHGRPRKFKPTPEA